MSTEELKKLLEEKNQVKVINKGIGPLSLLGIAFVVMKIMGYITWSWWWVLAPFWIPIVLSLTIILIVIMLITIVAFQELKLLQEVKSVTSKKKTRTKKADKDDGKRTKGENN